MGNHDSYSDVRLFLQCLISACICIRRPKEPRASARAVLRSVGAFHRRLLPYSFTKKLYVPDPIL